MHHNAFNYLDDHHAACEYLRTRTSDMLSLHGEINAVATSEGQMPGTLRIALYPGLVLVQDLTGCSLHATPCWGDVYVGNDNGGDPYMPKTYQCVLAFVLARYW